MNEPNASNERVRDDDSCETSPTPSERIEHRLRTLLAASRGNRKRRLEQDLVFDDEPALEPLGASRVASDTEPPGCAQSRTQEGESDAESDSPVFLLCAKVAWRRDEPLHRQSQLPAPSAERDLDSGWFELPKPSSIPPVSLDAEDSAGRSRAPLGRRRTLGLALTATLVSVGLMIGSYAAGLRSESSLLKSVWQATQQQAEASIALSSCLGRLNAPVAESAGSLAVPSSVDPSQTSDSVTSVGPRVDQDSAKLGSGPDGAGPHGAVGDSTDKRSE